jgi:CRP/FNR family cyclic AMP-dependent transcriptional regulator
MLTKREAVNDHGGRVHRPGGFFNKLSQSALRDLESMEFPSVHPARDVLFSEGQPVPGVFIILAGEVKLSMCSFDGKRLTLQIVKAGELVGIVSAISGCPAEWTAETLYPAKIAAIKRREFLSFLMRHPEVYQILTVELSRSLNMACGKLRSLGLSSSAPEKLARLLLDWSENGQKTESGTHFHFPLTHEEIGEFIGTSRETVTRTMSSFRHHRLVACHGATLTIPCRTALESYVGCKGGFE